MSVRISKYRRTLFNDAFLPDNVILMVTLLLPIAVLKRILVHRLDHVSEAKLLSGRFLVATTRPATLIEWRQLSGGIVRSNLPRDHWRGLFRETAPMMCGIAISEPSVGIEEGELRVQSRQDGRPCTPGLARLTAFFRAHADGGRDDRYRQG
jgi:hypothetical protein